MGAELGGARASCTINAGRGCAPASATPPARCGCRCASGSRARQPLPACRKGDGSQGAVSAACPLGSPCASLVSIGFLSPPNAPACPLAPFPSQAWRAPPPLGGLGDPHGLQSQAAPAPLGLRPGARGTAPRRAVRPPRRRQCAPAPRRHHMAMHPHALACVRMHVCMCARPCLHARACVPGAYTRMGPRQGLWVQAQARPLTPSPCRRGCGAPHSPSALRKEWCL